MMYGRRGDRVFGEQLGGSLPEPERDPELARAIRDAEGPPLGRARLELLRTRIAVAALAALDANRERTWWEWTSRWARTEVALAAAATVLAAVIGGATTIGRGGLTSDTTVAVTSLSRSSLGADHLDSLVTRSVTSAASSEQVMNALVGPASGEWLLTATVLR
jgi:hypothetical protein